MKENKMKKTTTLAFYLIFISFAQAEFPNGFVAAINLTETGGKSGPILGDGGAALGPLQIHRIYWQDAIKYDRSIGGRYEDCSDLGYSIKVMDAYMRRYAPAAYRDGDCEKMARIHNGGPAGHRKNATVRYWIKVNRWMGGAE